MTLNVACCLASFMMYQKAQLHMNQLLASTILFARSTLPYRLAHVPLKYNDKINRPVLSATFAKSKTIGGNTSNNWAFTRLLPLIIGHKVDNDDSVWLMLMELKDIVELAVASVHTEESVELLQMKIVDHRKLFSTGFPNEKLKPKHHISNTMLIR